MSSSTTELDAVLDLAVEMGADPDGVRRHLTMMPARYAVALTARTIVRHAMMIDSLPDDVSGRVSATRVTAGLVGERDLLDIVARPRGGTLRYVTGALAVAGGSIHSAQAFTREDDIAVDHFEVVTPDEVTPSWWARVEGDIADAAQSRLALRARVEQMSSARGLATVTAPESISVVNDDVSQRTTVSVQVADRVGLLFQVAAALSELGLDLLDATVATVDGMASDELIVSARDKDGRHVPLDDTHVAELRLALEHALLGRDRR